MALQHFSIKTIIFALNDYYRPKKSGLEAVPPTGKPVGFPAENFMTREEKIELLEKENALDSAIKALKQEAVLDKIRAEIEAEKLGYPPSAGYYKAIIKVLQIIDKYKAESEE